MKEAPISQVLFALSNPLNCCKCLKNKTRKIGNMRARSGFVGVARQQKSQGPAREFPFKLAPGTTRADNLADRVAVVGSCAREENRGQFRCCFSAGHCRDFVSSPAGHLEKETAPVDQCHDACGCDQIARDFCFIIMEV
jgi:hypothetical protein